MALTASLTLADVLESVSVGGDFRVLKAGALRVAIRGTWAFPDADFIKRLQPIIASHHKFWGDQPTPFLVTVLPLQSAVGSMSLGGTGLNDAFAFFATANVEDRQEDRSERGDNDKRMQGRLTQEERRELRRDLDRANREIYRR